MSEPPTIYERLGGHQAVVRLVDRFYDLMDTLPEAAAIRAMHPDDLDASRARLTLFLMMWTGGPRNYLEVRGHPRMRARHLPFPIDQSAADAWMTCMRQAMDEQIDDAELREFLDGAFHRLAQHMRNTSDG